MAVSVSDIQAVTTWYSDIMGFQVIGGKIKHVKRSETPDAPIFAIYGEALQEVKLAYMATGNGVGFEVFQFVDPLFKKNETDFEYNRGGFFHLCVTDADPEGLIGRIVSAGGSRVGKSVTLAGGVKCAYVKDPWGNVLEVLDTSFERLATMATAKN